MTCPHCISGAPSVWDEVFSQRGHPTDNERATYYCYDGGRPRLPMPRATFEVAPQETGFARVREVES